MFVCTHHETYSFILFLVIYTQFTYKTTKNTRMPKENACACVYFIKTPRATCNSLQCFQITVSHNSIAVQLASKQDSNKYNEFIFLNIKRSISTEQRIEVFNKKNNLF